MCLGGYYYCNIDLFFIFYFIAISYFWSVFDGNFFFIISDNGGLRLVILFFLMDRWFYLDKY